MKLWGQTCTQVSYKCMFRGEGGGQSVYIVVLVMEQVTEEFKGFERG